MGLDLKVLVAKTSGLCLRGHSWVQPPWAPRKKDSEQTLAPGNQVGTGPGAL